MKSVTKKIKRKSKESAQEAMQKHIDTMKAKGWSVDTEFDGNAGCTYECITWFYK